MTLPTQREIIWLCETDDLQADIYKIAKEHGFHDNDDNPLYVPTALALVSSECSEALEAHRHHNDEAFGEELADIVIRTFDLAESRGLRLSDLIRMKHEKNKGRTYRHGDKRY